MKEQAMQHATSIMLVLSAAMTAAASPIQWPESSGGNGHFYERLPGLADWNTATAEASGLRGYLVTLTSQAENDFVFTHFGGFAWLGMTDYGTGTWVWLTGEPFGPFINWSSGEPNSPGRETVGELVYTTGWNDLSPGEQRGVILEFDRAPGPAVPEPRSQSLFALGGICLLLRCVPWRIACSPKA
jgi:hypothetical protein